MFHTIRWRIAIPFMVLILLCMVVLALFASQQVLQTRIADVQGQLLAEARLMADQVGPLMPAGPDSAVLDTLARRWAGLLNVRITIIASDGTVLGDSQEDRARMENHLYRPEVQQAVSTGEGHSIRFSDTEGHDMAYAAVTVGPRENPRGFVRAGLSLAQVEAHVATLRRTILVAAAVTTVLAMLLALLLAERTSRPVRDLTRVAERIVAGDMAARLLPTTRDEVGQLTRAFDDMADHLQAEMAALAHERGRLGSVLEHMADGVIITDAVGRVLLANPAALRLLEAGDVSVSGRTFAQLVHNHQLVELWRRCGESGKEQADLLELSRPGLFLQVIVTPVLAADSTSLLVILQDLTRIRELETVRRDFVDNVSRELCTPLASLKALVHDLRDGALEDPAAAEPFLDRIETEVDALIELMEELLELARLESGRAPLRPLPVGVADVVIPPVERLQPQAERAGLALTLDIPPDLPPILADLERARQVVTNLVHNAIKFTPSSGQVTVSATAGLDEVVIAVRDTGVGIPESDLPRIFERFYKADRARSGGGSGLGLSLAKHIVQGHGGRIWVESAEGRGSTFYFSLPVARRSSP